jgi:hypothetical protein
VAAFQRAGGFPLLLFRQFDAGSTTPTFRHGAPNANRHRRAAIWATTEQHVAIKPELKRRL